MPDLDKPSLPRPTRAALILLLTVTPLMYALAAQYPLNPDPYIYGQIAKDLLAGQKLYTQIILDKGPLTAAAFVIPELVAPRSATAIGFFGGLIIVAEALLVWRLFRSDTLAVVFAVIVTVFGPLTHQDCTWTSTEHISNLFVMGALFLVVSMIRAGRCRPLECVAIGLLVGLAANVRQTTLASALVPLIAIFGLPVDRRAKAAGIGFCALGGLAAMAGTAAFMFGVSDLHSYVGVFFHGPKMYVESSPSDSMLILWFRIITSRIGVVLALACGLAWLSPRRGVMAAMLAAGLIETVAPMRPYVHYLVSLLPFIAVMGGLGITAPGGGDRRLLRVCTFVAMIVTVPQAASFLYTSWTTPTQPGYERVAREADRLAAPGATLMICGPGTCSAIQFASALPPCNRVWTPFSFMAPYDGTLPEPVRSIIREYVADPPGVIAVERDYLREAASVPLGDLTGCRLVLAVVMDSARYTNRAQVGDYVIFTRQAPGK